MKTPFKKAFHIWCVAIVLAATVNVTGAIAACSTIKPTKPGEIYLIRGLANIFSRGLDDFGKYYSQNGFANCVYNHKHWRAFADDIVERSRNKQVSFPIIIIGHSLGANVAPQMATLIGKFNIPVSYVVMLDPVEPTRVGKNVQRIVNVYLPKNKGNLLTAAPGFKGELVNVQARTYGSDIDHFNIHRNKKLLSSMYKRTLDLSNQSAKKQKR